MWKELVIWSRIMRSQAICASLNLSAAAGVVLHDPVLEVAAHGVVEGGEVGIHAADAADEGDQGGQFADRLRALVVVQLAVGLPDAERGEFGLVGLELVQHLADQVEA